MYRYAESWKHERLVSEVAEWAAAQDKDMLPITQPLRWIQHMHDRVGRIETVYTKYV